MGGKDDAAVFRSAHEDPKATLSRPGYAQIVEVDEAHDSVLPKGQGSGIAFRRSRFTALPNANVAGWTCALGEQGIG